MTIILSAVITFIVAMVGVPVFFGLLRFFGVYAIVPEGRATSMFCLDEWWRSSMSQG